MRKCDERQGARLLETRPSPVVIDRGGDDCGQGKFSSGAPRVIYWECYEWRRKGCISTILWGMGGGDKGTNMRSWAAKGQKMAWGGVVGRVIDEFSSAQYIISKSKLYRKQDDGLNYHAGFW